MSLQRRSSTPVVGMGKFFFREIQQLKREKYDKFPPEKTKEWDFATLKNMSYAMFW